MLAFLGPIVGAVVIIVMLAVCFNELNKKLGRIADALEDKNKKPEWRNVAT